MEMVEGQVLGKEQVEDLVAVLVVDSELELGQEMVVAENWVEVRVAEMAQVAE